MVKQAKSIICCSRPLLNAKDWIYRSKEWDKIFLKCLSKSCKLLSRTLCKIGKIWGWDLLSPCPKIIRDLVRVLDPSTVILIGADL